MNKKLAKVIMMGLLGASVLPSVGEAENIHTVNSSCDFSYSEQMGTDVIGSALIVTGNNTNESIIINFVDNDDMHTETKFVGLAHSDEVELMNNAIGQQVLLKGCPLIVHDYFDDALLMQNNGEMTIENPIMFNAASKGIENNGKLIVNNELELSVTGTGIKNAVNAIADFNSYLRIYAGDTNNGIFFDGTAIDNSGKLNIKHTIESNRAFINSGGDGGDLQFDVVQIFGDIVARENSETNITLGSNQYQQVTVNNEKVLAMDGCFSGALITEEGATVNLTINKAGIWEVSNRQESTVEGLVLNDGHVYLGVEKESIWSSVNSTDNGNWTRLKLANFSAVPFKNGGFTVHTDLSKDVGDRIDFLSFSHNNTASIIPVGIFDKSVAGKYDMQGVLINDFEGLISPEDGHSVLIATTPSDSNVSINGLATYTQKGQLYDAVVNGLVDGNTKYWNFVGWEAGEDVRPKDKAKQEQVDHSILVEDVEPIFKRFNDLRTDPSEIGVWVRGETGETKIRNLSYDHNIMSGGYDWDYKNDAGVLFAGVGFTYSTNECDDKAIGDTKGYGFNAYGSWLGKKNNDYVDLVVKYGKLDKSYAGYDENDIFVAGEYDKDLFTIAAKYGRRIFKDDWYYEPSVGLTWGRVGSADFTDNYGTRIHADNSYSNIASLGIQVGKNIKGIEYYGKAEVMHDFDGKIHVSAPGRSVEDDMGGTWVKCAIGASRKIDENNSFYLEVERDFGNKVEKPYGFSAGYRFTW